MASKKKCAKATNTDTTTATGSTTEGATVTTATGPTLHSACDGYIASMEDAGNSTSTVASYGMDLRVALDELGAETSLAEITPEMVATYYASKRVTKLKSGQPKAKASIDKTRRVLRLALMWAQDQGLIERAPLPEPATRSNGSGAR